MLLWNLVRDILPVGNILKRKIHFLDPMCMRCEAPIEDTIHLFRDCPNSSVFWSLVVMKFKSLNIDLQKFYNTNLSDWLDFNLSNSTSWKKVFTVAIWHIWSTRNTAIFENKMSFIQSTFNKFYVDYIFCLRLNQAAIFYSPSSSTSQNPRLWAPPQKGFYKLNTDGSWISMDNAGGGGVIRSDMGIWFAGFATKYNAITASSAELLAIRDGLLLAWDKGIKNLKLETDADGLSKMLKDPKSFEDADLGNIIRDVAALLERNWNVNIFHANRCVNYVADRLALMGRTKYKIGEIVPFNYPTPEVYQTYAMEIPEGQDT